MSLKFSKLASTFLVVLIVATAGAGHASPSQNYQDLNYRELLQDWIRNQDIPDLERSEKFDQVSKERLNQFRVDAVELQSEISVDQLKLLNKKFHESIYVGDDSDMALPLPLRNTTCYLRALWVHMNLLALGVPDENIRKIVLEGKIAHESVGYDWTYHIVTTVKTNDGNWYVFDLEHSQLKTVEAWLDGYIQFQIQARSSYEGQSFLLSVRPSRQYTLVDAKYDLSIDFGPEIKELLETMMLKDEVFSEQLNLYLKTQELPAN